MTDPTCHTCLDGARPVHVKGAAIPLPADCPDCGRPIDPACVAARTWLARFTDEWRAKLADEAFGGDAEIDALSDAITDARPIIEQTAALRSTALAAIDAIHRALGENLARHLTCPEMDAVADLYRALDRDPTEIIAAHAEADTEPGDRHG